MDQRASVAFLDPHLSGEPARPLVEELAPTSDAWEVFQRIAACPYALFLDSAFAHPSLGRYSFLTADPFLILRARGRTVVTEGNGVAGQETADPFAILRQHLEAYRQESVPGLPPFQGGAAGLLGYDLCHHLEELPQHRCDEFQTPDLAVGFYDWVISFDHLERRAWLLSTGQPETQPRRRKHRAARRLRQVRALVGSKAGTPLALPAQTTVQPRYRVPVPQCPGLFSNFERSEYLATVRRAIEYIHAGDCFQVNIAQRLLHPAGPSPLALYGRLRERNPAPFAGYFACGDFVVASASPERFLRVQDFEVETRPIKGTRPRGRDPAEDDQRRRELLASAKDRAENIMIVDLLRNDLGRVCRYGSVNVAAVCRLESYPFVHHLVSEVRGRLREGQGPIELLRAAFPGGSITGAPKIRAMEIIAELEPTARGPYCGCLGYLGFDGAMDTNLLIRTITAGGGWLQFPVGGGIVADSQPEQEYDETMHKAAGLLQALL